MMLSVSVELLLSLLIHHNVHKLILNSSLNTGHRVRVIREKERTVRRGETISLVFAMQGVGAVVGSLFVVCLLFFGRQGYVNCDIPGHNAQGQGVDALDSIWRTFYFIGLIFVSMVLAYRGLVLEEGKGHQRLISRKERRKERLGHSGGSTLKILKHYGKSTCLR